MKIDTNLCTGCRICEMICSIKHSGKINTNRSRIRIESVWPEQEKIHVCRQCKEAPCIKACPVGALTKDKDGVIRVNRDKCTLCKACVKACPFDAIFVGMEDEILICDTCDGAYECISWCPNNAISKEDLNE